MAALLATLLAAASSSCGATPEPAAEQSSGASAEVSVGPDGLQSITLISGDDYRFSPAEFTVAPGQVSLTLENSATQLTHSLAFPPGRSPSDVEESIPVVAPTESETIEFTVDTPGEYAFICSFHESLGHTGVMTVRP